MRPRTQQNGQRERKQAVYESPQPHTPKNQGSARPAVEEFCGVRGLHGQIGGNVPPEFPLLGSTPTPLFLPPKAFPTCCSASQTVKKAELQKPVSQRAELYTVLFVLLNSTKPETQNRPGVKVPCPNPADPSESREPVLVLTSQRQSSGPANPTSKSHQGTQRQE